MYASRNIREAARRYAAGAYRPREAAILPLKVATPPIVQYPLPALVRRDQPLVNFINRQKWTGLADDGDGIVTEGVEVEDQQITDNGIRMGPPAPDSVPAQVSPAVTNILSSFGASLGKTASTLLGIKSNQVVQTARYNAALNTPGMIRFTNPDGSLTGTAYLAIAAVGLLAWKMMDAR